MKQRLWYIVVIVIIGILCFLGGFSFGAKVTTDFFIDIGIALIEHQKIGIDIDENMIRAGIFQYKNNVAGCLFMEDAFVFNDTRSEEGS